MLYLDSSATLKLVRKERESEPLAAFLLDRDDVLTTSRVGVLELRRVARRGGASPDRADAVASSLEVVELGDRIESVALTLPPELRALDAIHLASALSLGGELQGFVCYDRGLAEAAAQEGLRVIAPGADG